MKTVVFSYVACFVALTVACSNCLAQSDGSAPATTDDQAVASEIERREDLVELRQQVRQFAPYASMHMRAGFGGKALATPGIDPGSKGPGQTPPGGGPSAAKGAGLSASQMLSEWTALREVKDGIFNADPRLTTAYRGCATLRCRPMRTTCRRFRRSRSRARSLISTSSRS